jgi:hypothetical protein
MAACTPQSAETSLLSRRISFRGLLLGLWLLSWPALAAAVWYPIATPLTRWAVLLVLAGLWAFPMGIWRGRPLRIVCLSAAILVGIFLLLPGRPFDHERLRLLYVQRLAAYDGTKYLWGGENGAGIDCSGLVLRAMVETLAIEGIQTANAALVRQSLDVWWHRSTARELGNGYDGRTSLLTTGKVGDVPEATLKAGDLAIVGEGTHIIAYLGDQKWIEAAPGQRRVRIFTLAQRYSNARARMVRWMQLQ